MIRPASGPSRSPRQGNTPRARISLFQPASGLPAPHSVYVLALPLAALTDPRPVLVEHHAAA
jgi:hypothetical protein